MKILYVGNFTQKHCTEVHIARTLESLGHEVIRRQENELEPGWVSTLPDDVELFMFTRTWGGYVNLSDLETLRALNIPSVSYHLDLYVGLSRKYLHESKSLDEVLSTDPFWRTDYVFTPDGDPESARVFKRNDVNHCYMKPGVFQPECVLDTQVSEQDIDVLFVGGGDRPGSPNGYGHPEWPYRDQLVGWLHDTYGDKFKKFGHPQETVRNEELNRLYWRTKVVVGDSVCLGFDHTYYWSDRVYETLGRGGFMIHPYIKGMEEEFVDGQHLVYYKYGDFEDLKRKIDYYMTHDAERERIRWQGHNFVHRHATYTKRMQTMLDTVFVKLTDKAMESMSDAQEAIDKSLFAPAEEDLYLGDTPFKINLGAGSEPTEGWVNVDWIRGPGIQVEHNLLLFPWPFQDGCAEEIKAIDVLEHMPNYTPDNQSTAIEFVRECWRLLQPGGILTIQVPHWASPNCWIDLTHVRGFDERSMDYFDPSTEIGAVYGYYSPDRKFKVTASVSVMQNQTESANDGKKSNVTFKMVKI